MTQKGVRFKSPLSRREAECVSWIAKGKTSSEISQILEISERTVNFHVKNSMDKYDAVNRTHLIALFITASFIETLEDVARHKNCLACSLRYGDPLLGTRASYFICHCVCGNTQD